METSVTHKLSNLAQTHTLMRRISLLGTIKVLCLCVSKGVNNATISSYITMRATTLDKSDNII